MSDPASYRIVGALGPSAGSPLLAEVSVAGRVVDRVVLDRPGAAEVDAAVRMIGSARLVAPRRILDTPRGPFALVAYVPGRDLDQLRSDHGAPVPDELARAVLRQVLDGLERLHEAGLAHGALRPSNVRLDTDGLVRLLGARGGDPGSDLLAVQDLARSLLESDDGAMPPGLDLEVWPADLQGLRALVAGPARALNEWPLVRSATVHAHALSGAVLLEKAPGSGTPPKVQLAAVSAVTLVLGFVAGWSLVGWTGAGSGLPAGDELQMQCEDLDGAATGRYLCVREEGGLRCTER